MTSPGSVTLSSSPKLSSTERRKIIAAGHPLVGHALSIYDTVETAGSCAVADLDRDGGTAARLFQIVETHPGDERLLGQGVVNRRREYLAVNAIEVQTSCLQCGAAAEHSMRRADRVGRVAVEFPLVHELRRELSRQDHRQDERQSGNCFRSVHRRTSTD